jgi:hypothetical protein
LATISHLSVIHNDESRNAESRESDFQIFGPKPENPNRASPTPRPQGTPASSSMDTSRPTTRIHRWRTPPTRHGRHGFTSCYRNHPCTEKHFTPPLCEGFPLSGEICYGEQAGDNSATTPARARLPQVSIPVQAGTVRVYTPSPAATVSSYPMAPF